MNNYFPTKVLRIDEMSEIKGYDLSKGHNIKHTIVANEEHDELNQISSHWLSEYVLVEANYDFDTFKKPYWELQQTINVSNKNLKLIEKGFHDAIDLAGQGNYFFNGIIAAQKYFPQDSERLYYWASDNKQIDEFNNKYSETQENTRNTLEKLLKELEGDKYFENPL